MPTLRSDAGVYPLGTALSANGAAVSIPGGEYLFAAFGTPAGATVQLQLLLPDQSTWAPVSVYSGSVVQATALPYAQTGVDLPACQVRLGVNGGTSPSVGGYLIGLM
jgi:hypothetical protein